MPFPSPIKSAFHAIKDLLGLGGYGTVEYVVGASGDLLHARTIATVKPDRPGERADLELFLTRLRRENDLCPDDSLQLRYDDGKLMVAIITRQVR
jgi:hypothetical protein